ncbi:MAG: PH domain-containing protein [Propionibacteriaceae bacterium]|nr:PH domain-containing protein [Propionibacteriaceae bacterium]
MTRPYYPRATTLTAIGLSVVLLLAAWFGWQALPPDIQEMFSGAQVGTLVLFVLVMLGMMLGLGLSHVRADDDGLLIRNGLRSHRIEWRQIEGFRFTPHDPWAYVLFADDPGSRPLMAVQRVDGARARRFVDELTAQWQARRP